MLFVKIVRTKIESKSQLAYTQIKSQLLCCTRKLRQHVLPKHGLHGGPLYKQLLAK